MECALHTFTITITLISSRHKFCSHNNELRFQELSKLIKSFFLKNNCFYEKHEIYGAYNIAERDLKMKYVFMHTSTIFFVNSEIEFFLHTKNFDENFMQSENLNLSELDSIQLKLLDINLILLFRILKNLNFFQKLKKIENLKIWKTKMDFLKFSALEFLVFFFFSYI